jgi:hypothetical protein
MTLPVVSHKADKGCPKGQLLSAFTFKIKKFDFFSLCLRKKRYICAI